MAVKRGECDVCHHRHRLRKDGTLGHHSRGADAKGWLRVPCEGTGGPQRPLRFDENGQPECGECLLWLWTDHRNAMLTEAIYSVSIEVPKSPQQLFREYVGAFHFAGHKGSAGAAEP